MDFVTEDFGLCDECESRDLSYNFYETVCNSCGLVLQDVYPYVAGVRIDLPYGIL